MIGEFNTHWDEGNGILFSGAGDSLPGIEFVDEIMLVLALSLGVLRLLSRSEGTIARFDLSYRSL